MVIMSFHINLFGKGDRKMKDLVSIIVPIYNVENYLERCLNTLKNQTYKNLDIILVNDGSKDNFEAIAKKFLDDERFHLYSKENGGLSDARNYGMKYAKGKYICFIDSDDYIELDYIEVLLKNMVEKNADISICNFYYEFNENLDKRDQRSGIYTFSNIDSIKEIYKFDSYGVGVWNKLFKIELFEGIQFPYGKISEDYYVMYKIFYKANLVVYDTKPLYHYIQRTNSITKNKKVRFDTLESSKEFLDFSKEIPSLYEYAKMNYVYSAIALYNTGLVNKSLEKEDKKMLVGIIKDKKNTFTKEIVTNKRWKQYKLFKTSRPIYNMMFITFKRVRMKLKGR